MVRANSPRFQAKSATMDFMSTDTAMESAECAVTARTPTASAVHACHDSPSGPPRSRVTPSRSPGREARAKPRGRRALQARQDRPPAAGQVALPDVVHHHAVGVEAPAERPDGALHARDPAARQAVGVARVVERDDLLARARGSRSSASRSSWIAWSDVRLRRMPMAKPFEPVVGLGPPAVEDREVEAAVEHHLLPAGARRLERAARIVEPDVDALHQVAADVDVVVLDEHDARRRTAARDRAARSRCSSSLPGWSSRVRLAGEDELDRACASARSAAAAARGRGRSRSARL